MAVISRTMCFDQSCTDSASGHSASNSEAKSAAPRSSSRALQGEPPSAGDELPLRDAPSQFDDGVALRLLLALRREMQGSSPESHSLIDTLTQLASDADDGAIASLALQARKLQAQNVSLLAQVTT